MLTTVMPPDRRRWTDALNQRALDLYTQTEPRLTREEIAEQLGVSFFALRAQLWRLAAQRPDWTRGRGRPRGAVSVVTYRIRCLGPVQPEHKFWSRDPKRHRVCDKCRQAMSGVFCEEVAP